VSAHAKVGEALARRPWRPVARFLARYGCVSIGTVYVLIGVWALLALWRLARPAADEERILQRIMSVPFGGVLTAAVAAGVAGWMVWLLFEAVFDPYHFGKSTTGRARRIGVALGALAYAAILFGAVKVLVGVGGHGEQTRQRLAGQVLEWTGGRLLIGAAGVALAVVGLYQLKYVYDREHEHRIRLRACSRFTRMVIKALAWLGFCARCAILAVLGYFLTRAAWSYNPRGVGDTDSAFDFLGLGGGPLGDAVFSAVAAGTIAYGLFMYLNAIYFDYGDG
jgi:hypothetical protein